MAGKHEPRDDKGTSSIEGGSSKMTDITAQIQILNAIQEQTVVLKHIAQHLAAASDEIFYEQELNDGNLE